MKISALILALAAIVGVAVYVSAEDAKTPASKPATTATAPATKKAAANGAINEYCAVEKDNKIDEHGKTYTYNGKIIGFCCDDCIDEFKKNPEKYMATLK
jgi:YHS domain-containing protein